MYKFFRSNFKICIFMFQRKIRGLPLEVFSPRLKFSAVGLVYPMAETGLSVMSHELQRQMDDTANELNWKVALLNLKEQERTNELNWEMNRENNVANLELAEKNNFANQQIANQYNANQVQLQNDMNQFNKEMWDLNNQYNSPSMQLARAKAAGVNPNSAFGIGGNISNSPVQQMSIPNQEMPSVSVPTLNSFQSVAPQFRYTHRDRKNLLNFIEYMKDIPEYDLRIKSMKEDLRAKRLENDEKEDANNLYSHMSFIINPSDPSDIVTVDNYDRLSPDEQKRYIKDGSSAPDVVVLPFKGKKGYDAFMDAINLRRNLVDSEADISQNRLRKLVSDGQLSDNDVVKSLIDMPKESFEALKKSISKIDSDISHTAKSNEYMDKAIEKLDEEIKEMKDSSLTGYITKITDGKMSMEDWLKAALVTLLRVSKR